MGNWGYFTLYMWSYGPLLKTGDGAHFVGTKITPIPRHFWVDDVPAFPLSGIWTRSLEGT